MKKRLIPLLCGALCALMLTACQGEGEKMPSPSPASKAETSAPETSAPETSAPEVSAPASSAPESQGESPAGSSAGEAGTLVFVQENSGAEAGYEPTVTLCPDGSFTFSLFLYDGTATLGGSWKEEEEAYVLTVTESTAQGFAAGGEGGSGEIRLEKNGDGVLYHGEQLGVTTQGASFGRS